MGSRRFEPGFNCRPALAVAMAHVEVQSMENGPNVVMVDGKAVATLCRCGGSSKKPQCDGTHRTAGFRSPAATTVIVP